MVELAVLASAAGVMAGFVLSPSWHLWRHGVSVDAVVDELPLGRTSCERCPLVFSVNGERQTGTATVSGGEERERWPGEIIEVFVDPNDPSNIEPVEWAQGNVFSALVAIGLASLLAVGWLVFELARPLAPADEPVLATRRSASESGVSPRGGPSTSDSGLNA
jgi:hypothetical protein